MKAAKDNRRAKPSAADLEAAERLRLIWHTTPRATRPTQDQVADALDATQSAVSQYLQGKIPLNARAVLIFASLLKCDPLKIRDDLPELVAARAIQWQPNEKENETSFTEGAEDALWRSLAIEQRQKLLQLAEVLGFTSASHNRVPGVQIVKAPIKVTKTGAELRSQRRLKRPHGAKKNVS